MMTGALASTMPFWALIVNFCQPWKDMGSLDLFSLFWHSLSQDHAYKREQRPTYATAMQPKSGGFGCRNHLKSIGWLVGARGFEPLSSAPNNLILIKIFTCFLSPGTVWGRLLMETFREDIFLIQTPRQVPILVKHSWGVNNIKINTFCRNNWNPYKVLMVINP